MLTFAPACGTVGSHIYAIDCELPDNGSCTCPGYAFTVHDECVLVDGGTVDSTVDGGKVDGGEVDGRVDDGGREDGRGDAG
jgi:hypothetical protein